MIKKCKPYVGPIVSVIGPVLFEIADTITGSWTVEGKIQIGIGKFITISIVIAYIVVLVFTVTNAQKEQENQKTLENKYEGLKGTVKRLYSTLYSYKNEISYIKNLVGFTGENIKKQNTTLNSSGKIDIGDFNFDNIATQICKMIYDTIDKYTKIGNECTVNIYTTWKVKKTRFTCMIAHEGDITKPSILCKERKLIDNGKARLCDRIIIQNNPEYVFLLTKEEVAKEFGKKLSDCNYNNYIGIPVMRRGGDIIALIEIISHNKSIIAETEGDAIKLTTNFIDLYKEYLLMVDRMQGYLIDISKKIV
jgi:hypothetical protein